MISERTSRQRLLDTFNYNHPDRIPLIYHPSPAGLYVHGQKLLDLFQKYPSDNPVTFDKIPTLGIDAFDANGDYHQVIKDEWGSDIEYRIFGIAGHVKKYPFDSWKEALLNYSFPSVEATASRVFSIDANKKDVANKRYLIFNGWISIFEKMTSLHPFDDTLMELLMRDEYVICFLDKLVDYWLDAIDYYHRIGTDAYVFGDDWGTQYSTMIDLGMFREIFKPRYAKLFDRVRSYGGLPFFHCCGFMGEIFDELVELGMRGLWHQLNLYEEDKYLEQKCKENKIAIFIHPDRQHLMPLGKPDQIRKYIERKAEKYKKMGGGGIFYVEIENDAPFENVVALFEAIDQNR
jgi:uroporphyrinogen-III decarboxylase